MSTLQVGISVSCPVTILGWVTVLRQATTAVFHQVTLGQLSLLPSAGREMTTSQSAVTLCGWGLKAGMAHSTCE